MKMQSYVDEIKLALTGGLLQLEISDEVIQKIVTSAMRELQRYICSTKIITLPYAPCIDLSSYKVNAVTKVLRAHTGTGNADQGSATDPVQVGLWQLTSAGGNIYNFNNYVSRMTSWSAIQQIGNTLSTDLAYYYEDSESKLYINTTLDQGSGVTIEYVPRYEDVSEITSDYWIDILMKLSIALTKTHVGRIRTRYSQSNALWTQDGETLLAEGQQELTTVREHLQKNTQLLYVYD